MFFYAVYYIKLTDKEIEKVENENLIDNNEKFENFCLQSKSKELVALFANKFQAELFGESIASTILARFRYAKIAKVSDPICIIKKIKIEIDE